MDGLKIKVRHVGGRTEELTVEADQVLIGSGAHCEVRLPLDQALFEHVLVRSGPTGLFASARAIDPPPTLNGAEFTEATIVPGSVLRINQSAIEISAIALLAEAAPSKERAAGTNARPVAILVLGVAAAAVIFLAKPRAKDGNDEPKQAPQLFDARESPCPQSAAQPADSLAEAKLSLAKEKRVRSPFYVQDGIAAVPLYELAAACFRIAGKDEDAEQAETDAEELRRSVRDEFRTHRMRLRYALRTSDWDMALGQLRILRAYTSSDDQDATKGNTDSEYAGWLSNLSRQIELAHSGKKKK